MNAKVGQKIVVRGQVYIVTKVKSFGTVVDAVSANGQRYRVSALPRAPLPKQTGGAHKTRKKELARKRKHKGREEE